MIPPARHRHGGALPQQDRSRTWQMPLLESRTMRRWKHLRVRSTKVSSVATSQIQTRWTFSTPAAGCIRHTDRRFAHSSTTRTCTLRRQRCRRPLGRWLQFQQFHMKTTRTRVAERTASRKPLRWARRWWWRKVLIRTVRQMPLQPDPARTCPSLPRKRSDRSIESLLRNRLNAHHITRLPF